MRPLRVTLPTWVGVLLVLLPFVIAAPGCKGDSAPPPVSQPPRAAAFPDDAEVAVLSGDYDGLEPARLALEAALRLQVRLPLPYPRVERHGDRYRVVLGRGKFGALRPLVTAPPPGAQVTAAAAASGDDVIRLGMVCTEGGDVPIYESRSPAGPTGSAASARSGKSPARARARARQEIGRVAHGKVLAINEEDTGPEGGSEEAEQGFVTVLAPQAGLLRGTDVLLPPDCTPRDEDNDDGNGRLLAGGRLCLTTRFSGKDGEVNRATLVAVAPNYARCDRFPDAGTFDSFDQDPSGTQFAVENRAGAGTPEFLEVYDVSPQGKLALRFRLPGLIRPAYLGDVLVATVEEPAGQGLVVIGADALRGPPAKAPPQPRRIFGLTGPRFTPAAPVYRPAAPTLRDGKVLVTFQQECDKSEVRRVRSVARADFEKCLVEVEVEVGLDGQGEKRRCQLNNSPGALEQPLSTPCR